MFLKLHKLLHMKLLKNQEIITELNICKIVPSWKLIFNKAETLKQTFPKISPLLEVVNEFIIINYFLIWSKHFSHSVLLRFYLTTNHFQAFDVLNAGQLE